MFDKDTMIVSYDERRGEGSRDGPGSVGAQDARRACAGGGGDCIDCGYCVQVCPTGIDIRNGLQIQCISCPVHRCLRHHHGFIWAGTRPSRLFLGKTGPPASSCALLRPKVIGYAAVLLVLAVGLLAWSVAEQAAFDISVQQVR